MRIAIGPLPSVWVHAWAEDALASMHQASTRAHELPFAVDNEFFTRNRQIAAQWVAAASTSDVFVWEGDADPDVLLTVIQYWWNLARVRRELIDAGTAPPMHVDAERFTQAMRRATVDALVRAGRMTPDHADRLEATWPRLSAAGDGDVAQDERHTSRATW